MPHQIFCLAEINLTCFNVYVRATRPDGAIFGHNNCDRLIKQYSAHTLFLFKILLSGLFQHMVYATKYVGISVVLRYKCNWVMSGIRSKYHETFLKKKCMAFVQQIKFIFKIDFKNGSFTAEYYFFENNTILNKAKFICRHCWEKFFLEIE